MDDALKVAIEGVKKLLITQLATDEFCKARRTGRALEELVNQKIPTATGGCTQEAPPPVGLRAG